MSDKPIAPCPNPECDCPDMLEIRNHGRQWFNHDTQTGGPEMRGAACLCGYEGPWAETEAEAIRLHNLICTHPHNGLCVECDDSGPVAGRSSIPRAQIEALEAELRSHAEQEMESDRKFWTRSMRLDCKVEMECADRLRALLHPELKGEDNNG